MTFNIRYGTANDGENSWPFRRDAVVEFLGGCGCDVIGLQEVLIDQLHEIREALPRYHWVGVAREDGGSLGEFAAMLYDSRRVELEASSTFWFSDTPEVIGSSSWGNANTRICTEGHFRVDGKTFQIYNLHIDHESAISRLKSIELLIARHALSGRGSVIVTGDFNEGEQGPAVQGLISAGFLDTYRAVNPDGPEVTTFNGWQEVVEGDKIDYIFTRGDWVVVDSEILRETPYRQFLSDHYPVVATLRLVDRF